MGSIFAAIKVILVGLFKTGVKVAPVAAEAALSTEVPAPVAKAGEVVATALAEKAVERIISTSQKSSTNS